jgi:prepilin-type N-terminal cleavage/methylation domain-containing protein
MSPARTGPAARAFTLVELIVVIVVLAILSGVAIPKYFDYTAKAKASSCKGTLDGVRAGIANFYANSATTGTPAYPTLAELAMPGTVMQEIIPANPYDTDTAHAAEVVAASWPANPITTPPPVSGTNGWNYDAAVGKFWANTSVVSENTW